MTHEDHSNPTEARVRQSLLCRTCGYDLRGLAIDANCPECAAPVRQAMTEDTLANAEPSWLKKLLLGSRLYAAGVALSILVIIGTLVVSIALTFVSGVKNKAVASQATLAQIQVYTSVVSMCTTLLVVVGTWFVTERNPTDRDDSRKNARLIARVGLIMYLIMSPWGMYLSMMRATGASSAGNDAATTTATTSPSLLVTVAIVAAGLTLTVAAVLGWAAYYRYVSQLLRRLPSEKLARQARIISWGYAFSVAILFFGAIGAGVLWQRGLSPTGTATGMTPGAYAFMFVGLSSCFGMMVFIAFEVWGLILHLLLAGRLRAALAPR